MTDALQQTTLDEQRIAWHEANPLRVYKGSAGWWIRPLRADGTVELHTHPTAAGAARAFGPYKTWRDAVDDARLSGC